MQVNLYAFFIAPENQILCFNCAVKAAGDGDQIEVEIEEYNSDRDTRSTFCRRCNHAAVPIYGLQNTRITPKKK